MISLMTLEKKGITFLRLRFKYITFVSLGRVGQDNLSESGTHSFELGLIPTMTMKRIDFQSCIYIYIEMSKPLYKPGELQRAG